MSKMRNVFYSFFSTISAPRKICTRIKQIESIIPSRFFKFFIVFFIWSGNFKLFLFFFSEGKVSPVFDRMCCAMEFCKHFWITLKIILRKLISTANLMFAFCNESKSSSSTNWFFMIIQKTKVVFLRKKIHYCILFSLVTVKAYSDLFNWNIIIIINSWKLVQN